MSPRRPAGQESSPVLGSRLRQLREGLGLVLQDVADLFHTNRNVPSQWEGSQREPSYGHLLQLADFYGVTTDWLLGREGAERDSPRVKQAKGRLHDYIRIKESTMLNSTPGQRMKLAIQFLADSDPEMFSLDRMARQLLVSEQVLHLMLTDGAIASTLAVQRFSQFANLPELWFWQPTPQLEDAMVKYRHVVQRCLADKLQPEEVEQILWGGKRSGTRSKRAVKT
jgi:transcriptional regulator with XRE-family HTH domain